MNILVVSTCTKSKTDVPNKAKDLYVGIGHNLIKTGVETLRQVCNVDWHIISAGKGLIEENTMLEPYDTTFQGKNTKKIIEMSKELKIADTFNKVVNEKLYDLIIILASKEYLVGLNLNNITGKNVIVVAPESCKALLHNSMFLYSPNLEQDRILFKAGNTVLKGKMFNELCKNIKQHPQLLEQLSIRKNYGEICRLNLK